MKKHLFYLVVAAAMAMAGCSRDDISTERPGDGCVAVELRISNAGISTCTADEYAVHNLNYYVCNQVTHEVRHLYATSSAPQRCELLPGTYTVFVLANAGQAVELLTQAEVEAYALTTEQLGDPAQAGGLWMSGTQKLHVPQERSVEVRLTRCVAKLRLTVEVAEHFAAGFRLHTMQLRRMPHHVLPFGGPQTDSPSLDGPRVGIEGTPYSATLYLPENLAGDVPSITDPRQRNLTTAPQDATYLLLTGEYDGRKVEYVVLIGENVTSNFDIRRNGVYDLPVRIAGVDTIDTRVAVTGMTLGDCAPQYSTLQALDSSLSVYCQNKPDSRLTLTCEVVQGDGTLTLNGTPYTVPLTLPAGEHYFAVGYRQTTPGAARLRFRLVDAEGYVVERELATTFVAPSIRVSFKSFATPETYTTNTTTFSVGRDDYDGLFELICGMTGLDASYTIDGQRVQSGDRLQLTAGTHTLTLESTDIGTADLVFTFRDTDGYETQLTQHVEVEPLTVGVTVEIPYRLTSFPMSDGTFLGQRIYPLELRLRLTFDRLLPETCQLQASVHYTLRHYTSLTDIQETPQVATKTFTVFEGDTFYHDVYASYEGYCIGYSPTGERKLLVPGYDFKRKPDSEEFQTTVTIEAPQTKNIRFRRISF